jgi:hypothetical protein
MSTQLRDLIASVLYAVKAHTLPSVCERFGMEPGDGGEAFGSKTKYIMRRLEKLSDEKVYAIAREVVKTYPNDDLQAAIEKLQEDGRLISDITRQHVAKALDGYSLGGSRDLMELLLRHFPDITKKSSYHSFEPRSSQ